jgi:GGDEF domain-containing protein
MLDTLGFADVVTRAFATHPSGSVIHVAIERLAQVGIRGGEDERERLSNAAVDVLRQFASDEVLTLARMEPDEYILFATDVALEETFIRAERLRTLLDAALGEAATPTAPRATASVSVATAPREGIRWSRLRHLVERLKHGETSAPVPRTQSSKEAGRDGDGLLDITGFAAAVAAALKTHSSGAFIHVDIDGLRHLRSEQGHEAVDRIRAAVVGVIRRSAAAQSLTPMRISDDQYELFAGGMTLKSALRVGQDLQREIDAAVRDLAVAGPPPSASIAVATTPRDGIWASRFAGRLASRGDDLG